MGNMAEYRPSMWTIRAKMTLSRLCRDSHDARILHRFSIESAPAETVTISELCVVIRTTPETVMFADCVLIPTYAFISTRQYGSHINETSYGN